MTTSVSTALPVGYDPAKGIRGLRARDTLPVSVRSITNLALAIRDAPDMNTGHVYASHVRLAIWGDGNWWFAGQLDDTSVLYGDNFAIGFSFEDGGFAAIKTGTLGSDATSNPQHIKFGIQGRDEGLQRNYFQVLEGGLKFRLYRSDEPGQMFSDIGDDLKWLGNRIKLMFSYDSANVGDAGDPQYPPIDGGYPYGTEDG